MKNKVTIVAITGGPCAGKTTALAYLRQKLEERGYKVLIVPEAATVCIENGLSPVDSSVGMELGQRAILALQYHLEDVWRKAAEMLSEQRPIVILCDRGIPDSKAYMPEELYEELLAEFGLNPVYARDGRYNAVIHMCTAADGKQEFYTLATNKARYETPDIARMRDEEIKNAWMGHPHLRVIDNSTDFEGKMRRVCAEIYNILGTPPIEHERKYLVWFDSKDLPPNAQRIHIEQFYPLSLDPRIVLRFRKRGQNGSYTYYRTEKRFCGEGRNFETEAFTTELQYNSALVAKRLDTAVVKKTRDCFVHDSQYFELDVFAEKGALPDGGALLEIEITDPSRKISFPEWLDIEKEVTGDPRYSNLGIAQALAKKN